jgi:hypothetical protein
MGFYDNQVVPRLTNLVMSRGELTPIRARVAASLDGEVLEVGFGSGLNAPHYPPAVTQAQAVDPLTLRSAVRFSRGSRHGRYSGRRPRDR